jgi:hypothetical protein
LTLLKMGIPENVSPVRVGGGVGLAAAPAGPIPTPRRRIARANGSSVLLSRRIKISPFLQRGVPPELTPFAFRAVGTDFSCTVKLVVLPHGNP